MRISFGKRVGWFAVALTASTVGCSRVPETVVQGTPATPPSPGGGPQEKGNKRSQRWKARLGQGVQTTGSNLNVAGVNPDTGKYSPFGGKLTKLANAIMAPGATPDLFAVANYANSPFVQVQGSGATAVANVVNGAIASVTIPPGAGGTGYVAGTTVVFAGGLGAGGQAATGTVTVLGGAVTAITVTSGGSGYVSPPSVVIIGAPVPGTGIRKFVDALPGLCTPNGGGENGIGRKKTTNNPNGNGPGQCLPIANPVTVNGVDLFPGSDTYTIGLSDYMLQMHSDLPPTKIRGYRDLNGATANNRLNQYLGPVIVAQRNRPVRVKFVNQLGNGPAGDLFIPTDTSYMGAGKGPDGTMYTQNRATLHLHGGNTPWISDGTPHQWTVPAGEDTNFKRGVSARDVPDMWFDNNGNVVAANTPGATNNPGDGSLTFYWTNEQSGRLMFYHDHSYGITRLNVYAGEAAGYLLVDPDQEVGKPGLVGLKDATVPGYIDVKDNVGFGDLAHLIPLVLQDKTFVPDSGLQGGQLSATDPQWDTAKWGGFGQLWYPHVYTPNQNPADITGANAWGRWDYGPWFWPAQDPSTFVLNGRPYECSSAAYTYTCSNNALKACSTDLDCVLPGLPAGTCSSPAYPPLMCPGTPHVSGTPESFMDTPVVNGTAYPSATVNPSAYRFQMLSAGNDRTLNLSLFYATTKDGTVCKGGAVADLSTCTEVSMVPAVPHVFCSATYTANCICNGMYSPAGCFPKPPGTWVPTCDIPSDAGANGLAMGDILSPSFDKTTGQPLNGPLNAQTKCWPTIWPTDGRDGGVPDPTTAGPPIIQIGAEGGMLPKPVVIPATPVNYDYNRRVITVLNVSTHGLLIGPAERADVVIDFSSVPAGSALILYNDAPAPVPGIDTRLDYYTNDPDQSSSGGAPSTPAGYGPNTRTFMQFKVPAGSANDNKVKFDYSKVVAAVPALFAATQEDIIVPETVYPTANGGAKNDTYVRIQDTSFDFLGATGAVAGINLATGGSGYTTAPKVDIAKPPAGITATATATIAGSIGSATVTNHGNNYTDAPGVSFAAPCGAAPLPACIAGAPYATATGVAVLAPTTVATINVTNGGSGYNGVPTVFVAPPGCRIDGITCKVATATAAFDAVTGKVTGITVVDHGAGYTDAPTIAFWDGGGMNAAATAVLAPTTVASIKITDGGAGYPLCNSPNCAKVTFTGGGGTLAAATTDSITSGSVFTVKLVNHGSGYKALPAVTFSGGGPNAGGATAFTQGDSHPLQRKAIQELFTLDYGRMNATLGVELPYTSFANATTIPYGYTDPPTELIKESAVNKDNSQFWKITHNGVDTHFIHFHLFVLQIINRVSWDGVMRPPDANEVGWKDTVRMNPLEDVIVAIRPMKQNPLPFKLPNSVRPLDVTAALGTQSVYQFGHIDPTNEPVTVVNDMTNFGWEYVWHCHILGHEENDMMRAMSFVVMPEVPSQPTVTKGNPGSKTLTVTWTDAPVTTATSYTIQVSTNNGVTWTNEATVAVPTMSYVDTGLNINTTYLYRIVANNVVGYTRKYAAPAVGFPTESISSAPSVESAGVKPL